MQILVLIAISLIVVSLIIYKINKKFELREFIILILIVIVPIIAGTYILEGVEEKVPKKFQEKYEKDKNVKILKLTYERLNNKNISSKTNFIYNFDYIVKKDGKEFFCSAKKVKIKKIEDEYIFENFANLKENCKAK